MTTRCSTGQALHDAYWAKIREASLGGWDLVTTARAEFLDYERHRAYCEICNPNIEAERAQRERLAKKGIQPFYKRERKP